MIVLVPNTVEHSPKGVREEAEKTHTMTFHNRSEEQRKSKLVGNT